MFDTISAVHYIGCVKTLTTLISTWKDELGLTYLELARRTGISNDLIGRWARGTVSPASTNLELLITKGFRMDLLTYIAGPNPKLTPSGKIDPLAAITVNLSKETVMLKIYSKFTATGFGEPDGEIEVPIELVPSSKCSIAVAFDQRMEPRIPENALVFIDELQLKPMSQKVILCLLNEKPILARWIKENRKHFLMADNAAWQPQRIEVLSDDTLIVLGTAVRISVDL